METTTEEKPCSGGTHKVDGVTPTLQDVHLSGRTCDCQRIKYLAEGCGCDNSKQLKSYPNQ